MSEWTVEYYTDAQGRFPVDEFVYQQPNGDRARILRTIGLLKEFGLQLGLPYVKHLTGKLWELRTQTGSKAYRVLYFAFTGRRFILLHAFLKKTEKTPGKEIAIAEQRLLHAVTGGTRVLFRGIHRQIRLERIRPDRQALCPR